MPGNASGKGYLASGLNASGVRADDGLDGSFA